ncbi:helix-turn-helix domain-containing protein [Streptomyces sp. NPDC055060]
MEEFAQILRAWRDRVRPEDVGLPPGLGRRAPGLRREELALLAGVSVDYIVRLEQGRARNPSPQLLASLARALRLTDVERDHLFRVAGAALPPAGHVPRHVTPTAQRMVDRFRNAPVAVAVHTAIYELVLWNPLWATLFGDPPARPGSSAMSPGATSRVRSPSRTPRRTTRPMRGTSSAICVPRPVVTRTIRTSRS